MYRRRDRILKRSKNKKKKDKQIFSLCSNFPTSSVQPTPFFLDMHHLNKEKIIVGYLRKSIQSLHTKQHRKMHQIISKIKTARDKTSKIPNTCTYSSYTELFIPSKNIINIITSYCVLDEQLIYSTRYEPDNMNITGIRSYKLSTDEHIPIQLWRDTNYFPRWNIMLMNRFKHEIIFIGGCNVKDNHAEYKSIAFYDVKTAHITTVDVDFVIGSNGKAVLVNERDLHIIGGQLNSKHILYDLHTNQWKFIYDFGDMNSGLQEQGLLYNPKANTLMMFGGYNLDEHAYYDDFYILDLNDALSELSMAQVTKYLVKRYMHETFLNGSNILLYDMSLNEVIGRYVGQRNVAKQWKRVSICTMINGARSFGAVLYDYRIIIVLGGIVAHQLVDTIYYLDVNALDGWEQSPTKCIVPGMCNAVLLGDVIHMLPYYAYTSHYTVHVRDILPKHLLKHS